ncbi:MAG: hypothetical protein LBQ59_03690 [Candidatus Peribacteria bacterium]|nr:hypothetical protein [Candidatus Peribacteria bacterium]
MITSILSFTKNPIRFGAKINIITPIKSIRKKDIIPQILFVSLTLFV